MDLSTTLETVRHWPVEDRLELMHQLRDQLVNEGWQPEPTDDLAAELDRRLAAYEANPNNARSWEQVVERVKKTP